MNEESAPRIIDVRTVGIPVSDQDRALEFYVEKLGFAKRLDVPTGVVAAKYQASAVSAGDV